MTPFDLISVKVLDQVRGVAGMARSACRSADRDCKAISSPTNASRNTSVHGYRLRGLNLVGLRVEAQAIKREAGFRARRWVVERTHSWLNRFRRILTRWEKRTDTYLAMLHLACGLITWRATDWEPLPE